MNTHLFSLFRGGYEEVAVHGEVVVVGPEGIEYQSSEKPGTYPARSLLKPFQFLAGDLPKERWAAPLTGNRYAPCFGSLAATVEQVAELRKWYGDASAKLSVLKVPASYPVDELHRAQLKLAKTPTSPWFHTCFAKHMGILEACEVHGWDLGSYTKVTHPFQKRLLECLGRLVGAKLDTGIFVEDGCTLPSPALSLAQIAKLYQLLATEKETESLGAIRRLMQANPEWVAGPKQLDTKLMQLNRNQIVVKSGADGLLAMAIPSAGVGVALKIAPGFYPSLLGMALVPIFDRLGIEHGVEYPKAQSPQYFYRW